VPNEQQKSQPTDINKESAAEYLQRHEKLAQIHLKKRNSGWVRFWRMAGLGLIMTVLWFIVLLIALKADKDVGQGGLLIFYPIFFGPPIFLVLFPLFYVLLQNVAQVGAPNSEYKRRLIRITPVAIYLLLVIVNSNSLIDTLIGAGMFFPLLAWPIYASALDYWTL
jgi:hypothetical protein